ncbi:MAG TPA: hypothetical protein VK079_02885 [Bacillota bacterium]|nr:hypothetical protein [Bacillota bacterium]
MKLIQTEEVAEAKRELFFTQNNHLNKEQLLTDGYLVEDQEQIIGCFMIEPLQKDIYWLKQLYISQAEARSLPVLLEAILTLAKQKQAKKVYVFSHQPMVDIILDALQFHETKATNAMMNDEQYRHGKWWTYQVS